MGAVFLLVLLPITAALGFMLMTVTGEASVGALFAGVMFVFLACVITYGALQMARNWDEGEPEPHPRR